MDMKQCLTIAVAAMVLIGGIQAQEKGQRNWKRLESIFQAGGGMFLEKGFDASGKNPGLALRASYGLDIRLDESWSVMPGIGTTIMIADICSYHWDDGSLYAPEGADTDIYPCVDVFCDARYRIKGDGPRVVVGLGPGLSYARDKDTYYIDADPSDPRNLDQKFKQFGIWLRPSVMFEFGKHLKLGLEGNIGLNNMRVPHPEHNITKPTGFSNYMIVVGFGF